MSALPTMRALTAHPAHAAPLRAWPWRVAAVDVPLLSAGCVLIRVHAAGLRRADLSDAHFYRGLAARGAPRPRAYVPGTDVSGVVLCAAPGVAGFAPGDEVLAFVAGACAEQVAVPAAAVWPRPPAMGHAEGCAFVTDGLVALQALDAAVERLPQFRARVLVTGAAAGAGIMIVQALKSGRYAAEVHVTVVYRDERALAVLEKLGADKIVRLAPHDSILDKLPVAHFDVAFDTAGIAFKIASLVKSPEGLIVSTDGTPPKAFFGDDIKLPRVVKKSLKQRQARIQKNIKDANVSIDYVFPYYTPHHMSMLMKMAKEGDVQTAYGPVYGIDNFQMALKATEDNVVGKVIMLMQRPECTSPRTRGAMDDALTFG